MDNPMNPLYDKENDKTCSETMHYGDMVVGMAYVPIQTWDNIYDMNEALARGTQFRDLDKPFFGEDIWK